MSPPPAGVGAITLFVEDPKRSKAFYERVFDLATIYEDDDAAALAEGRVDPPAPAENEPQGLAEARPGE